MDECLSSSFNEMPFQTYCLAILKFFLEFGHLVGDWAVKCLLHSLRTLFSAEEIEERGEACTYKASLLATHCWAERACVHDNALAINEKRGHVITLFIIIKDIEKRDHSAFSTLNFNGAYDKRPLEK
jgi:hypothetical protein